MIRLTPYVYACGCAALLVCGAAPQARGTSITLRTVALTGDPAPGTQQGFAAFDPPVMSEGTLGRVGFFAQLDGGGRGIWRENASGDLDLVLQPGDAAPGTGTTFTASLDSPRLDGQGRAAVVVGLERGDIDDSGIFREGDQGLEKVVVPGDAAPGTGGRTFQQERFPFGGPAHAGGRVAFTGQLEGGGGGIWREGDQGLEKVVASGDAAPGVGAGITFDASGFGRPALNASGQTAFRAKAGGLEGIWRGGGSALESVANAGELAPGTSTAWAGFQQPSIDGDGAVAFVGRLADQSDGIWRSAGTGIEAVAIALAGQAAPGTADTFGSPFGSAFSSQVQGVAGRVAFQASLSAGGGGIWLHDGLLAAVALAGQSAPGTSSTFGVDDRFGGGPPGGGPPNPFRTPVLNALGQIAFMAELVDGERGLWFRGVDGALQLIAVTGGALQVAPGDVRIVQSLSFRAPDDFGSQDGLRGAFSDTGALVFAARFEDGSGGVFVAEAAARSVPEPGWIALLAGAVLVGLSTRRRSVQR